MADLTRDTLFKAPRSRTETKAAITDQTARGIIDSEASQREAKTARLRAARLEMEKNAPPEDKPARRKPVRKKT